LPFIGSFLKPWEKFKDALNKCDNKKIFYFGHEEL